MSIYQSVLSNAVLRSKTRLLVLTCSCAGLRVALSSMLFMTGRQKIGPLDLESKRQIFATANQEIVRAVVVSTCACIDGCFGAGFRVTR